MEFIKILATSDATVIAAGMNKATRRRLDGQIGGILREYYLENTAQSGTVRTLEFAEAGITEDQGKAAIACARRLGLDIS